jgi:hypothetical protein
MDIALCNSVLVKNLRETKKFNIVGKATLKITDEEVWQLRGITVEGVSVKSKNIINENNLTLNLIVEE